MGLLGHLGHSSLAHGVDSSTARPQQVMNTVLILTRGTVSLSFSLSLSHSLFLSKGQCLTAYVLSPWPSSEPQGSLKIHVLIK